MPWPVVLIAAFLLPGSGHALLGERKRGALIGSTILILFTLGILIAGIRVVEFPDLNAPGNLLSKLLTAPWFDCAALAGPIAFICGAISRACANDPATAGFIAHARLFDIGGLYISIAGGLNLLAMIDAVARSAEGAPSRDQPQPAPPAATRASPPVKTVNISGTPNLMGESR